MLLHAFSLAISGRIDYTQGKKPCEVFMHITFKPFTPTPILSGHLKMGADNAYGDSLQVNSRYLLRKNRPVIPVMGEYHFCRDNRAHWRQELTKVKAGGIQIVATYLFWIYHEEEEGTFDFTGDLDIRAFIELCRDTGLDVVIRIGPWAHGECRNGGFPDWLQHAGIPLRCNDPRYLTHVRRWYQAIYHEVKGLLFRDGGPILGIQLDNELVDQPNHLKTLKDMAREIGFDVPLYTVTGWNSKFGARIPVDEVLPVFGGYVDAPWAQTLDQLPLSRHFIFDPNRNDSAVGLDLLRDTDADGWRLPYERYPFATCELGSGIQVTHHRRPIVSPMDAYALSLVKLGCGNNLIGYYMYHGGTHRIGNHSTFQESRASGYPNDLPILDYDFQTCLSQFGQVRESYRLLNLLHLFAQDFGDRLAPMEFVPQEHPVQEDNPSDLRCCLRRDEQAGFLFINHHQRHLSLETVENAVLHAMDQKIGPIRVSGDIAFFFPLHMDLCGKELLYATAQPICRHGNTFFFLAINGIEPSYHFADQTLSAQPGSRIDLEGFSIYTLTMDQARYLRRLDGELFLGSGCDLYREEAVLHAVQEGVCHALRFDGKDFVPFTLGEAVETAQLSLIPAQEPFPPAYAEELDLEQPRARHWYRLHASTPHGMVGIDLRCDAAQIYDDAGQLLADHFDLNLPWEIPAAMLFGKSCWLVVSDETADCYRESFQPSGNMRNFASQSDVQVPCSGVQ